MGTRMARAVPAVVLLALLTGCASVEKNIVEVSPVFADHAPMTIVVLPVQNETVDMDAPGVFRPIVEAAVPRRGYRLLEPRHVDDVVADQNIHDPGELAAMYTPKELGELFGADAVLYTVVTQWRTTYLFVYVVISVGARFELFDAKTETLLWKWDETINDQRIALDRDSAVRAAAFAARPYPPYVRRVVQMAFSTLPERAWR
jgi:hypothetical protein